VVSRPGTPAYGVITVAFALFGDCAIACHVSRHSFFPRPDVDSALLRTTLRREPRCDVGDERLFFSLVRAGFSQRRKNILNALCNNLDMICPNGDSLAITREALREGICAAGIDPERRAETLSAEEFARLANCLGRTVRLCPS